MSIKLPPPIKTRAQAEKAADRLADYSVQIHELELGREQALLDLNRKFDQPIAHLKNACKAVEKNLRTWCKSNRKTEFGKKQTLRLGAAIAAFFSGQPKIKQLKGWNAQKTIDALLGTTWGPEYVRQTPSIDKERLLADLRSGILSAEEAASVGVAQGRDETFSITILPQEEK